MGFLGASIDDVICVAVTLGCNRVCIPLYSLVLMFGFNWTRD